MYFRITTALSGLCCCIVLTVLSGCVARGPVAPAPAETATRPAALSFETLLASLPDGGVQQFDESPFGPAVIEVGGRYLSGLGNQCRPIFVVRGIQRHRAAICKEKNGAWRLIPPVFESIRQ